jgi:hypothetical protein
VNQVSPLGPADAAAAVGEITVRAGFKDSPPTTLDFPATLH